LLVVRLLKIYSILYIDIIYIFALKSLFILIYLKWLKKCVHVGILHVHILVMSVFDYSSNVKVIAVFNLIMDRYQKNSSTLVYVSGVFLFSPTTHFSPEFDLMPRLCFQIYWNDFSKFEYKIAKNHLTESNICYFKRNWWK
jgi:hypothetical protein